MDDETHVAIDLAIESDVELLREALEAIDNLIQLAFDGPKKPVPSTQNPTHLIYLTQRQRLAHGSRGLAELSFECGGEVTVGGKTQIVC